MFSEASLSDTSILAVTVDPRKDLGRITGKISSDGMHNNIKLLSDPGHKVIDQYGLLNPNSRGLPHPATYIIDKKGIVRWRYVNVDYRIRPEADTIRDFLENMSN